MGSDIRYNSFARSLETSYWSETSLPLADDEDDIFLLLLPITSTSIAVVVFLAAVIGGAGRNPIRFEYWVARSIMLLMPSKTLDDK